MVLVYSAYEFALISLALYGRFLPLDLGPVKAGSIFVSNMIPPYIKDLLVKAQEQQDIVEKEFQNFKSMMERKETPGPDYWQTRWRAEKKRDLYLTMIEIEIDQLRSKYHE
jgi:hypothetical protein